jgi:hypothetical protein
MDFDIDPEKFSDRETKMKCIEAIERLSDHGSVIEKEMKAYLSSDAQKDFLISLWKSRKSDLTNFPEIFQNGGCSPAVILSNSLGVKGSRIIIKDVAIWICRLSMGDLEKRIKAIEQTEIDAKRQADLLHELSSSQIAIAFYYGMSAFGLQPRKTETGHITDFARFLHLLTGKPFKKIGDSDYYDKLKHAPNFVDDQKLVNELLAVRNAFEAVGFKAPLPAIDKEISTARNAIAEKKQAKGKK